MAENKETRVEIRKTVKLFINGAFPRTESGRVIEIRTDRGKLLANACRASRKDLRNAISAARAAFAGWSARTPYNRAQILYRIGEMLEGRRAEFEHELRLTGVSAARARREVTATVDRLIYYAGWADKYQQIFGSVNPVASSHFNFSVLEPTGVVVLLPDTQPSLLASVSLLAPAIAGGNGAVLVVEGPSACVLMSLAEVIGVADVPAGVVNILTGFRSELALPAASHMDVNAIVDGLAAATDRIELEIAAAESLKRMPRRCPGDWFAESAQGPDWIADTQEVKTTWHPIETAGGSGGGY